MGRDPAVLFYTSDFLTGTSFFSYEERGQYITLLCQQHQAGSIPENHMISVCKSLDSVVAKKFIRDDDGTYYQWRMREETERRSNYCRSRSNNKSGRPPKEIIRKSYDYRMETEDEDETDKNKDNIKGYREWEQKVVTAWNKFIQDNSAPIPKIIKLSDSRRKHLKVRYTEPDFKNFGALLVAVSKQRDFLFGDTERGWMISFDWLIKNDTNYIKVLEGQYKKQRGFGNGSC